MTTQILRSKPKIPGIALCVVLGLASYWISDKLNLSFMDALVLSLIVGIVLRTVLTNGKQFDQGTKWSGKMLLEFAVLLTGASVFIPDFVDRGWQIAVFVVFSTFAAMLVAYLVGNKLLGLDPKLTALVGIGNSICGNSAVAALAPVIRANSSQVGAAISFSAILGAIQILLLPTLSTTFGLSEFHYGLVAGISVYAVAQVMAASSIVGVEAATTATLVKLSRVILLGPMIVVIGVVFRRSGLEQADGAPTRSLSSQLRSYVPWFVIGFLVLATFRSFDIISSDVLSTVRDTAKILFSIAMIGVGFGVNVRDLFKSGPRVVATILAVMCFMIVSGLVLPRILGII
jgi:uncharacterized integral membrane protein (TIGR00698 family)